MEADVSRRAAGKKPRWTTAQKLARAKAGRGVTGAAPEDRDRAVRGGSARGRPPRATRLARDGSPRSGLFEARGQRPTRTGRPGPWAGPEHATRRRDSAWSEGQDGPGRPGPKERRAASPRGQDKRDQSARRAAAWERSGGTDRRTGRERGAERGPAAGGARADRAGRESRGDRQRAGREFRSATDRTDGPGRGSRGPRHHEGGAEHHAQAPVRRERPGRPERQGRPERADRARADAAARPVAADNAFRTAGLPMPMVQVLAAQGIETPFPIQQATLPDALAGRDVLGRGQTGSGKTLAFGLPLIARLLEAPKAAPGKPLGIVLVPTRELAIQVTRALEPLARTVGLRHQLVAGGLSYTPQIAALEHGVEILVATPGRLVDLMDKHAADLSDVRIAVLDEADHMAEMGFVPEVTAILDAIPAGGQRLLFSATLDRGVDQIVETYLDNPVTHSTDDVTAAVTTMEHHILLVEPPHKKLVTAEVANRGGRTLVFARTKLGAERVAEQLREQGVFAAALHGGLNQRVRGRILAAFQDGVLPVLVATDVAARGIHVEGIELVLQIDPPADHKDYLHRAGRTARAGDRGIVVTLALPHQQKPMQRLAREAGVDVVAVAAGPGDPALVERTGARRPHRPPVPAEHLRRVVEGDPSRRRHGVRAGGRGSATRGRTPRG